MQSETKKAGPALTHILDISDGDFFLETISPYVDPTSLAKFGCVNKQTHRVCRAWNMTYQDIAIAVRNKNVATCKWLHMHGYKLDMNRMRVLAEENAIWFVELFRHLYLIKEFAFAFAMHGTIQQLHELETLCQVPLGEPVIWVGIMHNGCVQKAEWYHSLHDMPETCTSFLHECMRCCIYKQNIAFLQWVMSKGIDIPACAAYYVRRSSLHIVAAYLTDIGFYDPYYIREHALADYCGMSIVISKHFINAVLEKGWGIQRICTLIAYARNDIDAVIFLIHKGAPAGDALDKIIDQRNLKALQAVAPHVSREEKNETVWTHRLIHETPASEFQRRAIRCLIQYNYACSWRTLMLLQVSTEKDLARYVFNTIQVYSSHMLT